MSAILDMELKACYEELQGNIGSMNRCTEMEELAHTVELMNDLVIGFELVA